MAGTGVDNLSTASTVANDDTFTTRGVFIEPPPFRSVEEAHEFLRNHEIATDNKYIVETLRTFTTAGVATMKHQKLTWTYQLSDGDFFDGIPFAVIGIKKYCCQFGANHKVKRHIREEAYRRLTGRARRTKPPSKKVNCPARAKMTIIVKFPEYAIDENIRGKRYMMGRKMKREFSDDTQRYVLVHLRIYYHHEHGGLALLLNNGPSKVTQAHIQSTSAIVLKPGASLRGRSLNGVISQFASCSELPDSLAQPNISQRLETMKVEELLALYWDLTGETPNNVFAVAKREITVDGLQLLLHLCIVFANVESEKDGRIVAHRSIRIAGTENDFEPILCCETNCVIEDPHMHCPLCTQHTAYTDPNVLKTHYKKKHVDISIDCAGLKILRCRDECVVKGFIKTIKAYTSGHWHCWKCDMGYEKRDFTVRHFQSHLKNCQSGSVLVTKSVFPSTNSGTVMYNMNPARIKDFSAVKFDSTHTHNDSNSDNEDHEEFTSRPVVESDFLYTPISGEDIPAGYEETVMYIQEGDEQVVYSPSDETTHEVVVQISEQDVSGQLREKIEELEQTCTQLKRNNLSLKSHISVLNQKIEDLESKQPTCRNCSVAVLRDLDFEQKPERTSGSVNTLEKLDLAMSDKKEKKQTKEQNEKTQAALIKSLVDLRTEQLAKDNKTGPADEIDEEISEGIIHIKNEIEALKRITSDKPDPVYEINQEITKGLIDIRQELQTLKRYSSINNELHQHRTSALRQETPTPLPEHSLEWVNDSTDWNTNSEAHADTIDNVPRSSVTTVVEHDTTIVKHFIVESKLNSCTSDSGNIILMKSDCDERLNSDTTHTVDAITSNQSVDKMGAHGSSSMVSVTSKQPSVEKIMNSSPDKSVLVKAVKLEPSVEETLNAVGSILVNSITSESYNDEISISDGTSPVKCVKLEPSDEQKLDCTGLIAVNSITSESSVDKNVKSDGNSPASAVVEKATAVNRLNAGEKRLTSKPCVKMSSNVGTQTRGTLNKRRSERQTKNIDVDMAVAKKKRFN